MYDHDVAECPGCGYKGYKLVLLEQPSPATRPSSSGAHQPGSSSILLQIPPVVSWWKKTPVSKGSQSAVKCVGTIAGLVMLLTLFQPWASFKTFVDIVIALEGDPEVSRYLSSLGFSPGAIGLAAAIAFIPGAGFCLFVTPLGSRKDKNIARPEHLLVWGALGLAASAIIWNAIGRGMIPNISTPVGGGLWLYVLSCTVALMVGLAIITQSLQSNPQPGSDHETTTG